MTLQQSGTINQEPLTGTIQQIFFSHVFMNKSNVNQKGLETKKCSLVGVGDQNNSVNLMNGVRTLLKKWKNKQKITENKLSQK